MHPHPFYVAALILFVLATIAACCKRTELSVLALPFLAAGLACWVLPAAFQLT